MDSVRLSVNINQETAAAIEQSSFANALPPDEIVARAIRLYDRVSDETKAGRQLMIVNNEGSRLGLFLL